MKLYQIEDGRVVSEYELTPQAEVGTWQARTADGITIEFATDGEHGAISLYDEHDEEVWSSPESVRWHDGVWQEELPGGRAWRVTR